MFAVLFALFVVVFVVAFVSILVGAIRTMSLSGKIFQTVERQLDEQLSRPQNSPSDHAAKLRCAHCGTVGAVAEKCPNCGASIV